MPDTQPRDPTATPSPAAASGGSPESRTFAERVDISGEAPAELLMDDVQSSSGVNTVPEPGPDGTARFHDAAAGRESSPLKAAAGELVTSVRNVLTGKAGSARTMAKDAYGQLRDRSAVTRTKADAFVREKPYAAVGAAVVVGMLLSTLMRRR